MRLRLFTLSALLSHGSASNSDCKYFGDITFVIDRSSSIGDKLPLIQNFTLELIKGFDLSPETAQASVVAFNHDASVISELTSDLSTLENIEIPAVKGYTFISNALALGEQVLYRTAGQRGKINGRSPGKLLFLLTDGEQSCIRPNGTSWEGDDQGSDGCDGQLDKCLEVLDGLSPRLSRGLVAVLKTFVQLTIAAI